ncbi:sensor histidine kinase [Actinomadura sp. 9N407]|uniref:sensor histidine kinase n=1 Tax=Actinomadura sp. 9N407 TaxID=3375154 RepID=UPI0037B8A682
MAPRVDLAGWARRMPWALDAAVCAVAAAASAYRIGTGALEPGDRAVDGWAFGLGVAMAVCLAARRRRPALVLGAVSLLWLAYHMRDYPGGAPAVAVWIALYSAAAAPRRRAGLAVAVLLIAADALTRSEDSGVGPFDAVLDGSTVVFVAMLLLGDAVRSRRARLDEYEGRLVALAERREYEAAQRVAEERIRIARELHDVSAHTITVIGVQSSVAAELLDDDPAAAREALREVRRTAGAALRELRAAVHVLRDEDEAEGAAPAPGLDGLPRLVRAYGEAGPRIDLRTEGDARPMPRLVELTAYRIVQEALANALRHGDPELVEVIVRYRDGGLDLEIRDDGGAPRGRDGHGRDGGGPGGHGLRGMAERAAGLGGWVEAGRSGPAGAAGSGFRVRAWLPGEGTA